MPEGDMLRHLLKNYRSINLLKDEENVSLRGLIRKNITILLHVSNDRAHPFEHVYKFSV
jgi:hypothetical protein